MNERLDKLVKWTKEVTKSTQGLLVPVSGGTDSALAFWVCNQARPGEVLGVHTKPQILTQFDIEILGKEQESSLRAEEWFKSVGKLEITDTPGQPEEVEEMRWARFLRMSILKDYALVGSRTRTEDLLGTYSLASRVATVNPLIGTWKSDVIDLCIKIGVPDEVIASSCQPDCDCGRPVRMAGISFELRDKFLRREILGEKDIDLAGLSKEDERYLKGVVEYNQFKKDLPFRGPVI